MNVGELIGARNSESRKRSQERAGILSDLKLSTELHPGIEYPLTDTRLKEIRAELDKLTLIASHTNLYGKT